VVPVFFFPTYSLQHAGGFPQVSVLFDDGSAMPFELVPSPQSQTLFPIQFTSATFSPLAGSLGTLVPDRASLTVSGGPVGPCQLLNDDNFDSYSPAHFEYSVGAQNYSLNATTTIPEPSLALPALAATLAAGMRRGMRSPAGRIRKRG
jgi:hypothetical protein